MAEDMKKTRRYKSLKKSMLKDLEMRGLREEVYAEKVAEYMTLFEQREKLREDIDERGVVVEDHKREMLVENRSVSLFATVSKQMLAIWEALGFGDMARDAAAPLEDDEL